MGASTGISDLTVDQRLTEIAACLAQGIFDLQKRGRLGTSAGEFPTDSPASLDFGSNSGLSVNSGSISGFSNNH
jgi:hypothetical protein